jgi:hypothetical protein
MGSRMLINSLFQAAQKDLTDNGIAACEDDALLSNSAPANDKNDSNKWIRLVFFSSFWSRGG